jgi:enoyl-CoA hydratase/carnithine racemase
MSIKPAVLYEQEGHIVLLTLNRPEMRNSVSEPDIIQGLLDACERMTKDFSVRAAILTGAGSAFSSGGNLKAMAAPGGNTDAEPWANCRWYVDGIQRLPLERLEVPSVVAVTPPGIIARRSILSSTSASRNVAANEDE